MNKDRFFKLLLMLLPIGFYMFFSICDGVVLYPDSNSYIVMSVDREPIYSLFLCLFRMIFDNNDIYFNVVVIVQGLLMAVSIISLSSFLKKEFMLSNWMQLIIEFLFLFISLLCKYVASRGVMYSNGIESEALAYPLFILFFRYLLGYLFNSKKNNLIASVLLSFVLLSCRKQMYLSLFLLVLVLIYKIISGQGNKIYLSLSLIVCIGVIGGGNKLLDYSYNKTIRGFNATHTSSNRFLATVVFYCSDRSNSELIKDEKVQEVFLQIYDSCNEKGLLKNSINNSDNWHDRAIFFCDTYDYIQLHNMWPMEKEHVLLNNPGINNYEAETIVDSYNKIISSSLIPKIWKEMLGTFCDFFLLGLMTTVSAIRKEFIIYSFVIISLYITLLIYTSVKTRLSNTTLLGLVILISLLLNDCIVSAVIFPQTRYTIYNMGLFYTGGIIMLKNVGLLLVRRLKKSYMMPPKMIDENK